MNTTRPFHRTVAGRLALAAALVPLPLVAAAGDTGDRPDERVTPRVEIATRVIGAAAVNDELAGDHTPGHALGRADVVLVQGRPDGLRHVDDAAFEQRSVVVQIENGDVNVKIDGRDVPADRIVHEGDRVVILDAHGDEIEAIHIGLPGGLGRLRLLDRDGGAWVTDDADLPAPHVMLGIHLGRPGAALEKHLALEPGTTTLISGLYAGLPAERAGLEEHDIITQVDGASPADPASLRAALAERDPGDAVRLTVINRGRTKSVRVTLDAYDREAMTTAELIGEPSISVKLGGDLEGVRGLRMLDVPGFGGIFLRGDDAVVETLPGGNQWTAKLPPARTPGDGDLDHRFERLHERLADLERMLKQVLETRRDR